ncbi:MAG: DUF2868 domain-containing protein [Gammaproteobacteria bacterium]
MIFVPAAWPLLRRSNAATELSAIIDAMLLTAEQAYALTLIREAEALGVCGPPSPQPTAAARDELQALLSDARARIAANPELERLWWARRWLSGRYPGPWLLPAALAGGALLTGLAADGRFNILTPPLLGLIGWQLVVFAFLAMRRVLRPRARLDGLPALLFDIARRIVSRGVASNPARDNTAVEPRTLLAGRVAGAWLVTARGQIAAAFAATLHASAAAFAVGAIAGLYLDGLGVAYRATWASTFLDAQTVHVLVHALLGPAAALSGVTLPDLDGVAAMAHAPTPAAPWIHLWAATLLLFAVVPRLLLSAYSTCRARRPVPFEASEPWLQRSFAALAGTALQIRVQPLGYRPSARSWEHLQVCVLENWGPRARMERNAPLPWDAPAQAVASADAAAVWLMINPAQTPEHDVHPPLLDALQARVAVTVVLDVAAYVSNAERRQSRIRLWQRMLEAHGTPCVVLQDERPDMPSAASGVA